MSNVTPQAPKSSVRKVAASAIERITEVEKNYMMLVGVVNRSFGGFQQQLSSLTEVVDALVATLGVDVVTNAVMVNRQEKAKQGADQRRAEVAQKLERGLLVSEQTIRPCVVEVTDQKNEAGEALERVVDPGSIVASVQLDKAGEEVPGSYFALPLASVTKQFRDQLSGKEVGYEIPNEEPVLDPQGKVVVVDGKPTMAVTGKAVIVGVYKEVQPKDVKLVAVDSAAQASA